jgi:hypothetical protein
MAAEISGSRWNATSAFSRELFPLQASQVLKDSYGNHANHVDHPNPSTNREIDKLGRKYLRLSIEGFQIGKT